ncbi:hypothetical protein [Pleomorphomonas oryzae]|uniref:hypothetical protein n=1 Tax=Pleomorphomonas oryzae TaxID=261934 RepID=UPI000406A9C4|nr:hypothetical protein [Pleomorphomonas oryzae]
MTKPVLICPDDPSLLDRLAGQSLGLRVAPSADVAATVEAVRRQNGLFRLLVEADEPLAAVKPNHAWRGLPVDLMVPSAGRFADLAGRLDEVRSLGITVCLPIGGTGLRDARTLASLGIRTRLGLDGMPDWDALGDLMTYALLELVAHAPIEPFQTIADHSRTDARTTDWSSALFDDPLRFLHLSADGRIALSRRDLLNEEFVGDLAMLGSPALAEAQQARSEAWRQLFLDDHPCARCPGFRLCRGRYAEGDAKGAGMAEGCAGFFTEMAGVLEQRWLRPEARPW